MKRRRPIWSFFITLFIVCLCGIIFIVMSWKTLVLDLVEDGLKAAFKGSVVRVGNRDITPGALTLRDIVITKDGRPIVKIGSCRIGFTTLSLFRDRAVDFVIEDMLISEKVEVPETRGAVTYLGEIVWFDRVSAKTLGGVIRGSGMVRLGKAPRYAASLRIEGVRLEEVVAVLELNKKIDLTGPVSGSVEVAGEGTTLTRLRGTLKASGAGGSLIIKDKEWLDAIAAYAKQDVSMIVEGFKNYHYNGGYAGLGLEKGSVVIDAHLTGETGNRDMVVALHDFI